MVRYLRRRSFTSVSSRTFQAGDELSFLKLAEARTFIDIASKAATNATQQHPESAEDLRHVATICNRDLALASKLIDADPALNGDPPIVVFGLTALLFDLDAITGQVRIKDSKLASAALLRLAEMVEAQLEQRGATARLSDNENHLVAVRQEPKRLLIQIIPKAGSTPTPPFASASFTPIQLVLTAISLPSVSEESYRRGLKMLARLYEGYGAPTMARRLEEKFGDSESHVSQVMNVLTALHDKKTF